MKILFFSDNFPPETNAPASRGYEHACEWVKLGHQVTVLTCAPNFPAGRLFAGYKNCWYQVEWMNGIKVIRVKTFITQNSGFALRILDYLSFMLSSAFFAFFQECPDIVLGTSPQFFTAVGAWFLSFARRLPFVFEVRDLWPASIVAVGAMQKSLMIRFFEKLELFLYRRAALIITVTQAFKDDLVSRGISPEKIQIVLNGINSELFSPRQKDAELLKFYHLENRFVVAYIGTHGMAHQLENILFAAQRLQVSRPEIYFLFVGEGAEKSKLLQLAKDLQLANVCFIPAQPKSEIARYWSLCDMALVHLKNDPVFSQVIPSKIFEAVGMEIPILLAAPRGESQKLVENYGLGAWVPAGQMENFVASLEKFSTSPQHLTAYRATARTACKQFSRQAQASHMLGLLKKVAAEK